MELKNDSAISIFNVTKTFHLFTERNATLKEKILYRRRAKPKVFVALRNVSIEIPKGKTIALIGTNGSGKSTLLKIISRILYPDTGSIRVNGRMSSLLELGAGFHPDFTGRENIYMNGALFGLSKKEISAKLNTIIEFSELGSFIDQPVRSYSSGMYTRLAFSVAVAVEPEILLIDEVLAVGDAAFQQKCLDRLRALKARQTTIVIVTHDSSVVTQICDYAIWLHHGEVQLQGDPVHCVQQYLEQAYKEARQKQKQFENKYSVDRLNDQMCNSTQKFGDRGRPDVSDDVISIERVNVDSRLGEELVRCGEKVTFEVILHVRKEIDDIAFSFKIFNGSRVLCYGTNTTNERVKINRLCEGIQKIKLEIPEFLLTNGRYFVDFGIQTNHGQPYLYRENCCEFEVISDIQHLGICSMSHAWGIIPVLN